MSRATRFFLSTAVLLTAMVAGVAVGAAQPWGGPSNLNRQASITTSAQQSVNTRAWYMAMPFLRFCPRGQVAVDVSLAFTGAIDYKVIIDDGPTALPGPITVNAPSRGSTTSSFTFLWNAQAFEANDHHYVQLWWRATSASGATLRAASLVAQYQQGSLRC